MENLPQSSGHTVHAPELLSAFGSGLIPGFYVPGTLERISTLKFYTSIPVASGKGVYSERSDTLKYR